MHHSDEREQVNEEINKKSFFFLRPQLQHNSQPLQQKLQEQDQRLQKQQHHQQQHEFKEREKQPITEISLDCR